MRTHDSFLKLKNIKGQSKHKKAEDQIELVGWRWGVQNASSSSTAAGLSVGKAVPDELTFVHDYDTASTALMMACAKGTHIDDGKLTVFVAGEGQQEYLTVTLKGVMVTSVKHSTTEEGLLQETVTLAFHDIEFEHKALDDKGKPQASSKCGWNVKSTEVR
ncbi:hypothetical protein CI15_29900 [Paraburkholderia monticola]|uniref:Hcp1 family type VI secretion system effector n=1 Tax=Paraburkholderia monticola TaxID=1399968 RepID=A0A149PE41_9BURK|nr:type VI secretion system tube protein Hcp [Paraburkholderia monticola]KXU83309.1 hypothetical protein CI15_29900 [Paraburkholderia monticola]